MLAAINGADEPIALDRRAVQFDAEAGISGIKLGYLPEAFGEGPTKWTMRRSRRRRLGVEVVEVSLPDLPYGALMNIVYAEARRRSRT